MRHMENLLIASGIAIAATVFFTGYNPAYARGVGNPLPAPVVYVTGQDLYYDTLVPTTLNGEGVYQKLELGGPHGGPQTEFGLGDSGYLGGRWWLDVNGNDIQDPDDAYFSCPLLGPGRMNP